MPSLNATSINDIGNPRLIHLLELINAPLVELLKLGIQLIEVGGGQREPRGHLSWGFGLGGDWHQQVREAAAALTKA